MVTQGLVFIGDYLPESTFCRIPEWDQYSVVANLETVIAESGAPLKAKAYSVILDSSAYEHIAESKVSAFNVANNHVYDAGPDVFEAMLKRLKSISSIQFYGLREQPFAEISAGNQRCAVIGCLESCRARGPRLFPIEDVTSLVRRIRSSYDRIYVTPHWGKEGEMAFHPSPSQRRLARQWIDAGADGIFGHHPHTIHGAEQINDRPVYYSLGNYQFDHIEGREYPASYWGMSVALNLTDASPRESVRFHFQDQGHASLASREATAVIRSHFDEISRDLQSECSTRFGWARAVGQIYLSKNGKSWRKRLKSQLLRTLPLWVVWNLLPQTIMFRIASLAPRTSTTRRLKEVDLELTRQRLAASHGDSPDCKRGS